MIVIHGTKHILMNSPVYIKWNYDSNKWYNAHFVEHTCCMYLQNRNVVDVGVNHDVAFTIINTVVFTFVLVSVIVYV